MEQTHLRGHEIYGGATRHGSFPDCQQRSNRPHAPSRAGRAPPISDFRFPISICLHQPVAHRDLKAGLGAIEHEAGSGEPGVWAMSRLVGAVSRANNGAVSAQQIRRPPAARGFPGNGPCWPSRVAQKLVAHIPRHFQRGDFQVRRMDAARRVVQPRQRLEFLPAFPHQVAVEKFRQFPRHEHAAPQQVGPAVGAAVFQQAGIFGRGQVLQQRRRDTTRNGAAQQMASERPEALKQRAGFRESWDSRRTIRRRPRPDSATFNPACAAALLMK